MNAEAVPTGEQMRELAAAVERHPTLPAEVRPLLRDLVLAAYRRGYDDASKVCMQALQGQP